MNWPWVLCLIRDCLPLNPDLNLITFITFKQSDENLEMCRVTPRKINSENLHAVQLGPCMGYSISGYISELSRLLSRKEKVCICRKFLHSRHSEVWCFIG